VGGASRSGELPPIDVLEPGDGGHNGWLSLAWE
jgi:hypothetical protein